MVHRSVEVKAQSVRRLNGNPRLVARNLFGSVQSSSVRPGNLAIRSRRNAVSRNLFGASVSATSAWLEDYNTARRKAENERWSFDFANDEPIQGGNVVWDQMAAAESPSAYHEKFCIAGDYGRKQGTQMDANTLTESPDLRRTDSLPSLDSPTNESLASRLHGLPTRRSLFGRCVPTSSDQPRLTSYFGIRKRLNGDDTDEKEIEDGSPVKMVRAVSSPADLQ